MQCSSLLRLIGRPLMARSPHLYVIGPPAGYLTTLISFCVLIYHWTAERTGSLRERERAHYSHSSLAHHSNKKQHITEELYDQYMQQEYCKPIMCSTDVWQNALISGSPQQWVYTRYYWWNGLVSTVKMKLNGLYVFHLQGTLLHGVGASTLSGTLGKSSLMISWCSILLCLPIFDLFCTTIKE